MKAEEIYATVDENGLLHIDQLLQCATQQKVKLIVLAQKMYINDKEWMK